MIVTQNGNTLTDLSYHSAQSTPKHQPCALCAWLQLKGQMPTAMRASHLMIRHKSEHCFSSAAEVESVWFSPSLQLCSASLSLAPPGPSAHRPWTSSQSSLTSSSWLPSQQAPTLSCWPHRQVALCVCSHVPNTSSLPLAESAPVVVWLAESCPVVACLQILITISQALFHAVLSHTFNQSNWYWHRQWRRSEVKLIQLVSTPVPLELT